MMETLKNEFLQKVRKVRELIVKEEISGVIVETQMAFSWLTGGRGFIGMASEMACGSLIISMDKVYLITNNIERPRLSAEEIEGLSDLIEIKSFPWYNWSEKEALLKEVLNGGKFLTDVQLGQKFNALRSQLSDFEIDRYAILGKSSAEVVEGICKTILSGVSEFEIAGKVSEGLWKLGIEPITVMVAFDERLNSFRHPIPTDNRLKKYGMIVICARRWGLVVSLTRIISLGSISEEVKNKHRAVADIDACFIENTRPGIKVKDIFEKAVNMYGKTGFGAEWMLHHQGGATGYGARTYIANANSQETVLLKQAFAWNPSIAGTKSEDTIIVLSTENKILTHSGKYVYLECDNNGKKLLRPDILVI
jgi:Xaa-Pro dipeptidase